MMAEANFSTGQTVFWRIPTKGCARKYLADFGSEP